MFKFQCKVSDFYTNIPKVRIFEMFDKRTNAHFFITSISKEGILIKRQEITNWERFLRKCTFAKRTFKLTILYMLDVIFRRLSPTLSMYTIVKKSF